MNLLNPNSLFIGKVANFLKNVDSTNNYAKKLLSKSNPIEGTVIYAANQQAGRGQIGSRWQSEADKNMLLSVLLYPKFLKATEQFMLSKVVCLAAVDLLKQLGVDEHQLFVKWPNDIYIGQQKVGGILIENQLKGTNLSQSVVGIGLNINQAQFDASLLNPTSVFLQTGQEYDVAEVISRFCEQLEGYYLQLKSSSTKGIDALYLQCLLGYQQWRHFQLPGSEQKFKAQITGINPLGQLCLIDELANDYVFSFKEVVFCFG